MKNINILQSISGSFLMCLSLAATAANCVINAEGVVTSTTECWAQPDEYTITIHQIGLCTSAPSAPTTSAALGISGCASVFESSAGREITLTRNGNAALPGTINKPPNATYTHGYAIINSTMEIKSEYTINRSVTADSGGGSGTKCWTKASDTLNWASASVASAGCGNSVSGKGVHTRRMNDFSGDSNAPNQSTTLTNISGDRLDVYLVDNSLQLGSGVGAGQMGTVTRLAGVVTFVSPVVVANDTVGMDIGFRSAQGSTLGFYNGGASIDGIGTGPFEVKLQLTPQ